MVVVAVVEGGIERDEASALSTETDSLIAFASDAITMPDGSLTTNAREDKVE